MSSNIRTRGRTSASALLFFGLAGFSALGLTACGAGGAGAQGSAPPAVAGDPIVPAASDTTSNTAPASSTAPTSSNDPSVAIGESCTGGDSSKICLAMHFVTYKDSGGKAVASQAAAATIIHTMNTLWAACNIGFQIEKYDAVTPADYGLSYGSQSQNELNAIRGAFSSPSNELLGVTTGPWGTAVNAWTNMPGSALDGAVMEASIVGYGGGIIYAHEFGHYLGLDHVSDTSNLMNPVIYTTSKTLSASQCAAARSTASSYWSAMRRQ